MKIDANIITRIEEEELPTKFALEQNYPNPFNPSTTISYTIQKKRNVIISVYNSLGEVVAILENRERETGRYSVMFNGTQLSSGVYFYKLQAGVKVLYKKMLLIK